MELRFTIFGRLHGLNDYIAAERTNKHMAAKMKREDMEIVIYSMRPRKLKPPVSIHYHYFEPNRRRDKDNVAGWCHKVIQDALVLAKVIPNDGWGFVESWRDEFSVDKENPRIEVSVKEL